MKPFTDSIEPLKNAMWLRMLVGQDEYQGTSFRRSPQSLGSEIMEELLDIIGWSFIAWHSTNGESDGKISKADTDRFIAALDAEDCDAALPSKDPHIQCMVRLSAFCCLSWSELAKQWGWKPKKKLGPSDKACLAAQRCARDVRKVFQSVGHEPDEREVQDILMEAIRPTISEFIQEQIGIALDMVTPSAPLSDDDDD